MKRYLISLLVLVTGAAFSYAQERSSNTIVTPVFTNGRSVPAAGLAQSKDSLALAALDRKEAADMQALQDKLNGLRKKFTNDMKDIQDQITALKEKSRSERYAILDRITPGSGASQAKRDKELSDLETAFRTDLDALDTAHKAELSKAPLTTEGRAKFEADRKALADSYSAKRQELLLKPLDTTEKQAPPLRHYP